MALWTPAEITTELWLDANDSDTITLDGSDNVEQWDDKSGNDNHVSQSTSGNRPALSSAAINGLNAVSFDDSNSEHLISTSNIGSGNYSVFYVQKTSDNSYVVCSGAFEAFTPFFLIAIQSSTSTTLSRSAGSPNYMVDGATVSWSDRDDVYTSLQNRTSLVESLNVDFTEWDKFWIGGFNNAANHFTGDVGEIIIVSGTPSESDRQKIEGYLAHKWGFEDNLPADHPYKSAAPGSIVEEVDPLETETGLSLALSGMIGDRISTPLETETSFNIDSETTASVFLTQETGLSLNLSGSTEDYLSTSLEIETGLSLNISGSILENVSTPLTYETSFNIDSETTASIVETITTSIDADYEGYSYLQFIFPVPKNIHKQFLWINQNCNLFFAAKEKYEDPWAYFGGNASHELEAGRLLTSYSNSIASVQENYLTTDLSSTTLASNNPKYEAIHPVAIQAKYLRVFVEANKDNIIYEWHPAELYSAQVINGELEVDNIVSNSASINTASLNELTFTSYNDVYFPMDTGKLPGANYPNWEIFDDPVYEYTFSEGDYINLPAQEIPHSYEEGSDIEVHTHIATNGSAVDSRYVRYKFYYTLGNMNGIMTSASVVSNEYEIENTIADKTHLLVTLGTIPGAGLKIGANIKGVFSRESTEATAPTNDPYVFMVGLHVKENMPGSRNIYEK